MSQEYMEITERTVSEAITVACQKLGVPSERLEYEVIDPGKTGFLGIGSRAAKIRARIRQGMEESTEIDTSAIISDVLKGKGEKKKASNPHVKEKTGEEKKDRKKADRKAAAKETPEMPEKAEENPVPDETGMAGDQTTAPEAAAVSEAEDAGERKVRRGSEKNQDKGNRERSRGRRRNRRFDRDESAGENRETDAAEIQHAEPRPPRKKSAVPNLTDAQIEEIRQRADTFLTDVFQAMGLEADISSSYDKENGMLTIDMKGENMGVLIGKRGQTLDSLQYLVSLVVNKGVEGYIHVKADTENYRERRKKTLENLAKNIASRVKRNRTSVALEPMNPYERRIIHSALQGDRYVTTYSEGEEPYRKVIVTMKDER